MKKSVFAAIAFIGICLGLASCGGNSHVTAINLPDSTMVGQDLPKIDGDLSEYYSVIPLPYVLNLTDTTLTLKVKLKLDKKYVPNKYVELNIGNADSLASPYPYLVLTDSVGSQIPGFRMEMDSTMVAQLAALMPGETGVEVELTFTSVTPKTPEQLDSLAAVATNFAIVANLDLKVDSATIDNLINQYAQRVRDWDEALAAWMYQPPMTAMGMQLQIGAKQSMNAAERRVESVVDYMTPEQQQRYQRIRSSKRRVSWM